MRSAVDTNILARLLVGVDRAQLEAVQKILLLSGTMVISNIVLCETMWVLGRALKRTRDEIGLAVSTLGEVESFELDRPAADAGLAVMAKGGDFADGVMMHEATRLRCDQVITLDRAFAKIGGRLPVNLVVAKT